MRIAAHRTAGAIGALAIVGALTLTGCSSGSDEPSPTPSTRAAVAKDDQSVTSGSDLPLPEGWPKDLPMPDGVSINNIATDSGNQVLTAATKYTSVQDAINGFKEAWTADGVSFNNMVVTSVLGTITAEMPDGSTGSIQATMTGDTATVVVTYAAAGK